MAGSISRYSAFFGSWYECFLASWESWGRICAGKSFVEEFVRLMMDAFRSLDKKVISDIIETMIELWRSRR